jgi:hypothetical protein
MIDVVDKFKDSKYIVDDKKNFALFFRNNDLIETENIGN